MVVQLAIQLDNDNENNGVFLALFSAGKLLWKGAEMVAGDTNGYGSEEHGDTGADSATRLSPAGQQAATGAGTRTSLVKMSADKRAKKVTIACEDMVRARRW